MASMAIAMRQWLLMFMAFFVLPETYQYVPFHSWNTWKTWSEWNACPVTCGTAMQIHLRSRTCGVRETFYADYGKRGTCCGPEKKHMYQTCCNDSCCNSVERNQCRRAHAGVPCRCMAGYVSYGTCIRARQAVHACRKKCPTNKACPGPDLQSQVNACGTQLCERCEEQNVDYLGSDTKREPNVVSLEACQRLCQENATCTHFTYGKKSGQFANTCFLKNSDKGRKQDDCCVSGPAHCPH